MFADPNLCVYPVVIIPFTPAAVTDAMMKHTQLMLNSVDQFNMHYGETLRR